MLTIFRTINDHWFLTEPLLFSILCSHKLIENNRICVPMRVGNMRIEYNKELLGSYNDDEIIELLKIETIRIILKHPYQRQPYNPLQQALSLASTVTIAENYHSTLDLPNAESFNLPPNLSFEEYYKIFVELFKAIEPCDEQRREDDNEECDRDSERNKNADIQCESTKKSANISQNLRDTFEQNVQLSALWEEDNLHENTINDFICKAQETNSWGSFSGDMVNVITATLIIKLDYRKILNSFRASVLSSNRKLTRMRPSRRYGFDCMGSRNEFTTRLLVAVDVSGSVTDADLQNFFSVVNRFFKYGIKQIDVMCFDTEIKGEISSFKKAKKSIQIQGRGGTDFQCVFDFLCENILYDGLLIFTDGYAPMPTLKRRVRTKLLWVLDNKENYEKHKNWITILPKSRAVWLE